MGPEARSTSFQSMCWKAKVRDSALGTLGEHLSELSSTGSEPSGQVYRKKRKPVPGNRPLSSPILYYFCSSSSSKVGVSFMLCPVLEV